jgi:CMP-N,N'-diacetyllegionaminic acid synthase
MKILALIPARKGSKRLPNKNSLILEGIPLIDWTIKTAKSISEISDILISTDDPNLLANAESQGVLAPWLRPKSLSEDDSSSVDVAIHAIDWYESKYGPIDGLILLQPTSPFRKVESVKSAIELFKLDMSRSIVSVRRLRDNLDWIINRSHDQTVGQLFSKSQIEYIKTEQDNLFYPTGSIYIIHPNVLRSQKKFMLKNSLLLEILDQKELVDIDTKWDLAQAKYLAGSNDADL